MRFWGRHTWIYCCKEQWLFCVPGKARSLALIRTAGNFLLKIPVIVTGCPQLHPVSCDDRKDSRVCVPLQCEIVEVVWLRPRGPQGKLPVPETIPLKEDDINAVRMSLDASHEVPLGPPAQASLETVDRLADTVKLAIAVEDTDHSPQTLLEEVDGNIGAIAPPADGTPTVVVGAEGSLIDLLGDGRITKSLGLGSLALKLRLLLAPSDRDVLGFAQVVGAEGGHGDQVKGPAHEDGLAIARHDDEEFLVRRPADSHNGWLHGAYDFHMGRLGGITAAVLIFHNGDDITTGQEKACGERVTAVMQALDGVWAGLDPGNPR